VPIPIISQVISLVKTVIKPVLKIIPDKDLQVKLEHDLTASLIDLESDLARGQIDINIAEAKHKSIFVAGWRPFIGWVGGIAMLYQFLIYPLLTWIWAFKGIIGAPPPMLDTGALYSVITGMLGIGAMRSFDKMKGTVTNFLKEKK